MLYSATLLSTNFNLGSHSWCSYVVWKQDLVRTRKTPLALGRLDDLAYSSEQLVWRMVSPSLVSLSSLLPYAHRCERAISTWLATWLKGRIR